MQDGIIVGIVGGTFAGLAVWVVQLGKECAMTEWHKRRVYNWLCEGTKKYKVLRDGSPMNDPLWVSTLEVACFTNLTPERVRYICSIHKKIRPRMESDLWKGEPLGEKWAIREFVINPRPL